MEKENDKSKGKGFLVCARATQPWMTEGTVFDKCCSQCGTRVMIGRSGQQTLATEEGIEIMCLECSLPVLAKHEDISIELAGKPGQMKEDCKTVRVNTWKDRN